MLPGIKSSSFQHEDHVEQDDQNLASEERKSNCVKSPSYVQSMGYFLYDHLGE